MKETDKDMKEAMERLADMQSTIEASNAYNEFADGCSCKGCKVCQTINELHFIRDILWYATGKFETTYEVFYNYDKYGDYWWEKQKEEKK